MNQNSNNIALPFDTAPRTWIEISQGAVSHNIDQLLSLIPEIPAALVVKANAYGHGATLIASLAENNPRITYLCTAGTQEAVKLRAHGISKPIIAMAYIDSCLKIIAQEKITLSINSIDQLRYIEKEADEYGHTIDIHIKFDTGMGRLGIQEHQVDELLNILASTTHLRVTGIMSHLHDTGNIDTINTYQQERIFYRIKKRLEQILHKPYLVHIHSSGALDTAKKVDLVRLGSLVYGHWKSVEQRQRYIDIRHDFNLIQPLTWKTRPIAIKTVPIGGIIGYGTHTIAKRDTKIALLPVGYADGYPRFLSNSGRVKIGNYFAPLIGAISMNIITIDVTDIPEEKLYSDYILCGPYKNITNDALALQGNYIANEFTTGISTEITRSLVI